MASPKDRYEVIRKWGWGEYSTVWQVQSQLSQKSAAMKVLQAQVTDVPELQETNFLRCVLATDPTHPGFQHVYHLLDDFYLEGPNGRHHCIVPIPIVKSIFRQVTLALMYLHEKCNILHTDVKSNNILLVLPERAESPTVKLIDLGVGVFVFISTTVTCVFTQVLPELRAPEVAIGAGWGTPAEVWSLACLVYDLTTGKFLFPHDIHQQCMPHLQGIFFGPYPLPLIERGRYREYFFKEDGSPLYEWNITASKPLDHCIRRYYEGPNVDALIQFLELVFRLEPEERPTLRALLEHPWLAED
ncbi:kinase-like protein [Roridomyces roridus]|uniref:non-specific serine/threonine protein kinase n=1 Tax=Roridomyces roridus TaxID=1738132 RepID=A0AAD7C8Z4_9AGAR|nr:kinase-like protein [Roridomyces roridus]